MAYIKVKPLPQRKPKGTTARRILAELCFYYPQYTLNQAKKLPYKDVVLLLKTAHREKSKDYLMKLNIETAPHTKKGQGVKKLAGQLKEASDG